MTNVLMSVKGSADSFLLLRVVAATVVVVHHALGLAGAGELPILQWSDRQLDAGALAVIVFFVVSGYLITASWQSEPQLAGFLRKRALRLWPALIVTVSLAVFVVGPLHTTLALRDYFTDPSTWSYFRTLTLAPIQTELPGVFAANPTPQVNAALWTLPLELICYCLLAVLGQTRLLNRRWPVALAAATFVLASLVVPAEGGSGSLSALLGYFFLGSLARVYRLPLKARFAAMAAVVCALSVAADVYVLAVPAMAYLVLVAGSRRTRVSARVQRFGDPSYGIYIYSVLLQQSLVAAGVTEQLILMPLSVVLSVCLGYVSWHALEKRAVALGRRQLPNAVTVPALPAVAPPMAAAR